MITMHTRLARWMRATIVGVCLCAAPAITVAPVAAAQQQPPPGTAKPPASTDEFVPIDQLPPSEQLPAAPFLIGAYTVAWLAVLVYLWSLWRRLVAARRSLT